MTNVPDPNWKEKIEELAAMDVPTILEPGDTDIIGDNDTDGIYRGMVDNTRKRNGEYEQDGIAGDLYSEMQNQ